MSKFEKSPEKCAPDDVSSVARACDLLAAFRHESECLRLCDLIERTQLSKTTVFRILSTLVNHGLVVKVGGAGYRSTIRSTNQFSYRIGYATQSNEFSFSRSVTDSIRSAAITAGIELIILDNEYNPRSALRNVEVLLAEKVHLVMEFQTSANIAPVISAKFTELNIPMIAIEIPHPNATYYGGNNSQAGLMSGRHLARWAETQWNNKVDEVILIELPKAGNFPNARLTGSILGIQETFPNLDVSQISILKSTGQLESTYEKVRRHLNASRADHVLVSAINDPCAIGALRAFEESGRAEHCAVVGHNGSSEAIAEMRCKGTRLIGSVGYFPERYGEGVIDLAKAALAHKFVPPTVFVKHQMITPGNVDRFYPAGQLGSEAANPK